MVLGDTDVDPVGGEPVVKDGDLVGYVSSASYGHRLGRTVALGFLNPALCRDGELVDVCVLDKEIAAEVSLTCAYDPEGIRARA